MKIPILIAILLAAMIVAVPFLLDRKDNSEIEKLQEELRSLKGRVAIIEFNAKHTENNANRVIRKVEEIAEGTYYRYVIPISKGYLMVREE